MYDPGPILAGGFVGVPRDSPRIRNATQILESFDWRTYCCGPRTFSLRCDLRTTHAWSSEVPSQVVFRVDADQNEYAVLSGRKKIEGKLEVSAFYGIDICVDNDMVLDDGHHLFRNRCMMAQRQFMIPTIPRGSARAFRVFIRDPARLRVRVRRVTTECNSI